MQIFIYKRSSIFLHNALPNPHDDSLRFTYHSLADMFAQTQSELTYEVYTCTTRMNLLVGDICKKLMISRKIIPYYILYSHFFVINTLEPTCNYVFLKPYIGIFDMLC